MLPSSMVHLERVVDLRQLVRRELDVDHRAHAPGRPCPLRHDVCLLGVALAGLYVGHDVSRRLSLLAAPCALAPAAISETSRVICAWRALL